MENPIKMDDLGVPLFLETSLLMFFRFGLLVTLSSNASNAASQGHGKAMRTWQVSWEGRYVQTTEPITYQHLPRGAN